MAHEEAHQGKATGAYGEGVRPGAQEQVRVESRRLCRLRVQAWRHAPMAIIRVSLDRSARSDPFKPVELQSNADG